MKTLMASRSFMAATTCRRKRALLVCGFILQDAYVYYESEAKTKQTIKQANFCAPNAGTGSFGRHPFVHFFAPNAGTGCPWAPPFSGCNITSTKRARNTMRVKVATSDHQRAFARRDPQSVSVNITCEIRGSSDHQRAVVRRDPRASKRNIEHTPRIIDCTVNNIRVSHAHKSVIATLKCVHLKER